MIDKPKRGFVDEPGSYAGAKGSGIKLTAAEIKILKDNLTKQEFAQLDFDRTGVQAKQKNYGISSRGKTRSLFKKVRALLEPGTDLTAQFGQLHSNEKARNYIIKEANKGTEVDDIVKGLKKFKLDTTVNKNRVSSLLNKLPEVKEEFKRVPSTGETKGQRATKTEKVMKIVNDAIKNKTEIPSLNSIARDLGFDTYAEVGNIIKKEKGEKFYKAYFKTKQAKQKQRIEKLANNGKVVAALSDGSILQDDMVKYVSKLLKTDVQTSGNALYDLREAYKGKKTYIKPKDLPKINAAKGFDAIAKEANKDPFNNPLWSKVRVTREGDVAKAIGEDINVFSKKRRDTLKNMKPFMKETGLTGKGVGLETDEVFNLSTAFKTGGEGYATFQQTLTKTGNKTIDSTNLLKAKKIDRKLVDIRKKMSDGTATPKDVKMYNQAVNKITADINATIPKNLPKVRAITFVEGGDPNKTVGNIKQLKEANPTAYKTIIDDAEKTGYSAKIPKDIKTIYDQGDITKTIQGNILKGFGAANQEELLQKVRQTPKQKLKNIFNKVIRRVAETPTDDRVRYASANNIMSDAVPAKPKEEFSLFDYAKENPFKTAAYGAAGIGGDVLLNKARFLKGLGLFETPAAALTAILTGNLSPEAATAISGFSGVATKELGLLKKSKGIKELAKKALRFPVGKKFLGQALYKNIPRFGVPLIGGTGIATLGSAVTIPIAAANKQRKIFNRMKDNIAFAVNEQYPNASPDAKKFAIDKTLSDLIQTNNPAIRDYSESITLPESEMSKGQMQDRDVYDLSRKTDFETGQMVEPSSGILNFFNRLAGGGIAKSAGVNSGPPPEKGPTPQGLDFILKRGR
tara:strand:- start:4 stop:2568 length:2565 start_codon:yes stop_codon:yes gene_type:complete